jgi:REP element-mobilizing transposase RayT
MPSPPRILLPDYPVFITSRVEEGLPFVATALMRLIIESILARGQSLFDVAICHLLLMGNHLHLLMLVRDPDRVAAFMNYFKTETGHAINRLLGRRKRTVWVDGYDGVPVLTVEDVIKQIAYIYTNPQKAGLVERIEEYPGFSTWGMYQSGNTSFSVPWVHRNAIPRRLLTTGGDALLTKLKDSEVPAHTFTLQPNAWMKLFGIEDTEEISQINGMILEQVRENENELIRERLVARQRCLGAERLKSQPINKPFSPKKFGRRMWCVCRNMPLRVRFIKYIKELLTKAKEVASLWRHGDTSVPYPLGLFPPRFPRLANLIPMDRPAI